MKSHFKILLIFVCTFSFSIPLFSAEPTTFAVIGDFGSGTSNETLVANLVKSWSPQFVVTTGDNRYSGLAFDVAVGKDYCQFLKNVEAGTNCAGGTSSVNAFFPSTGNHDYTESGGISWYLNYFQLPGTGIQTSGSSDSEKYYNFIQGPIHFFVIDSYDATVNGTLELQKSWLQTQMAASTAIWKIVYFHHPPYSSSSNHGSTAAMRWPFATWGADAVLNGHDHTYERLMIDGIPYMVNGLGGMSKYAFGTPLPESITQYSAEYGAQKVIADDFSMTFYFININNVVIDEYTIFKSTPPDNNPPVFISNPITGKPDAMVAATYNANISGSANDADNDPLSYSKVSGPEWLTVSSNGLLSGIPENDEIGSNSFTVRVADNKGGYADAGLFINVTQAPTPLPSGTIDVRISRPNDDVEQRLSDGYMYFESTDIELGNDLAHNGEQSVGLLFRYINVPNGATITSAYIEFETDETANEITQVSLKAQAIDNAPDFSTLNNLSSRITTSASVPWNIPAWSTLNEKHISPELQTVIQELVNRSGWLHMNNIAIIIDGTGLRTAEAYDGEPAAAAMLHIEYTVAQNNLPKFLANPIIKTSIFEDLSFSGSIAGDASDTDLDVLTFSKLSGPAWLTVAANGDLSGIPLNENVGVNSWEVQVSDGKGGTDQSILKITVTNTNDFPVFNSDPIVKSNAIVELAYSGSITSNASDVDGDNLMFTKVSGPAWLTISNNGSISGTPANTNIGLNIWKIKVDDGNGGTATAMLNITVEEPIVVTYCSSSGIASSKWIQSIQFNNITNTSGNSNGYDDFTTGFQTLGCEPNNTVSISLNPGFSGKSTFVYWAIWLDYNKNGTFETEEMVYNSFKSKISILGSFIPRNETGIIRMRISMSDISTPQPCGSIGGGEVEDYLVNISPAGVVVPVANFSANKTNIFTGETIDFSDLSLNNPESWFWNFGNGQTASTQNPSVTYTAAGNYTVSLTVLNSAGSNEEIKSNFIIVTAPSTDPPVANFSADVTSIIIGAPVQFNDLSSNIPTSWLWDFGDGKNSTSQNPLKTYNTAGTYTVSLQATNGFGTGSVIKNAYITVSPAPVGSYCEPSNINNTVDYINFIRIGGTENPSGKNTSGFTLFTIPTLNFSANSTYPITLQPLNNNNRNFWRIWLDANGDGDYDDANETLFSGNNKKGSVTGSITIPSDISAINTRLRISMKTGSSPAACDDNFSGEVEDYNVAISPGIKSVKIANPSSVAFEENAFATFNVFPNPVTDKLFVRFKGWDGVKEIKIIDITGRSVFKSRYFEDINEIDVSSFPKGIYLINAKNDFHQVIQKIKICN